MFSDGEMIYIVLTIRRPLHPPGLLRIMPYPTTNPRMVPDYDQPED